jgi:hypothetical protein
MQIHAITETRDEMNENGIVTITDTNIPCDAALIADRSLITARNEAMKKAEEIAKIQSSQNGYLATAYFSGNDMIVAGRALGTGLRPADPGRGPDDTGTNYAALAISKILQCVRTGAPAGLTADFPKGEFNYKGSVILESSDGWRVYFSFSGFPDPKNDNAVAMACAGSFIEAMKYYTTFPGILTE